MRRLIIEEPYSMAAVWSRRLGLFAIAVAAMAIVLARVSGVETSAVLSVLGASFLLACLAVLLAATAAVVIWRTGCRGIGLALAGTCFALFLLAYPAFLAARAVVLPKINDISTDIVDPPAFSRSARATAARGGYNPPGIEVKQRDVQTRAYPAVQPIVLDLEPDKVFDLVLKAVQARGWHVVDKVEPGGRTGVGHVDAIDRTLIMGFPDDITIRVRPLAGQTRVDIRSASRTGAHDFGTNARRIEKFIDELQTQLEAR
jgi:uncharacterized protein (DUF1499 family)